jgi:hypothetical protein
MRHLINDKSNLIQHISHRLNDRDSGKYFAQVREFSLTMASSVLFLLGNSPQSKQDSNRMCLILTKRSSKVRQPGDLCCPGGSIAPRVDTIISTLMKLPFMPLAKWPYRSHWRRRTTYSSSILEILLAAAIRESVEEMRLNPFGLSFLGTLPAQSLVMFERVIYPLVGLINRQRRFYPNWEVEKVVYIPLEELLKPENYARYRLQMVSTGSPSQTQPVNHFPCFRHRSTGESETLWGATYQITLSFLQCVFDFHPPDMSSLPVVNGRLDENYLTGSR